MIDLEPLTPREHEVWSLLSLGLSNPEIAIRLGLAVRTIDSYAHTIYDKLDVRNRTEAALLWVRTQETVG
ncbi:MAG: helix-turn-helix transcriptional regulator [Stenomitos rutilans HA7619-LM2]|jgi:DNA-binding NarL/FixJ family response regulator|nr:helix-turn-helix transcriptional regulator [Stenomitos rutilans HA7619-LM2]MBW4469411.1 helix-turn-helix transcriptional regulator [Stenomitos rutilans HA7619-LM2]